VHSQIKSGGIGISISFSLIFSSRHLYFKFYPTFSSVSLLHP